MMNWTAGYTEPSGYIFIEKPKVCLTFLRTIWKVIFLLAQQALDGFWMIKYSLKIDYEGNVCSHCFWDTAIQMTLGILTSTPGYREWNSYIFSENTKKNSAFVGK